jgi:cytochrome-b5 reductase
MADVQHLIQLCQANPIPVAVALAAVIVTIVLALRGSGAAKAFLDPQQFKPLSLIRIDQLTHNTKRFVFALPDPKMRLGLPTGQHITFLAKDDEGKDVYR